MNVLDPHPLDSTMGEVPDDELRPGLAPGTVIARRYVLGEVLGRGGFGTVYAASDTLGGGRVALKLLDRMGHGDQPRLRRELSALRLLRIPGVVNLLDDGLDERGLFLVMDLVEGQRFPAGRTTWEALAETVSALLETLGRIHAAGVVHRDLKPSNVLVTETGRPVVLDFGLAVGPGLGPTITRTGAIVGTPAYLAPEQIDGGAISPATDLYAFGLLLYEALTGRRPHEGRDTRGQILARLALDPVPLRFAVSDVPRRVAEVVEALLARDPSRRPQSVAQVLGALAGERPRPETATAWLGPRAPVEALIAAAVRGTPVRVVGLPGSGRSRCLREAADALAAEGHAVRWLEAGTRPFDSLEWLLAAEPATSLHELTRRVEADLRAELDRGLVIVVDDAQEIDACSRDVLRRVSGAILSTDDEAPWPCVSLQPLTEEDLRPLFHGPDRLMHLREDAARILCARTDGLPGLVVGEAGAWVRAGLAEVREGRLAITRLSLDRIRAGTVIGSMWAPAVAHLAGIGHAEGVASHHREILAWIELARRAVTPSLLARAMGEPLWRVEAELLQLESLGFVDRLPDGTLRIRKVAGHSRQWSEERRRSAHASLAATMAVGSEERLTHLVLGGVLPAVAREGLALARQRVREGELGAAASALAEGLVAARATDGASEHELLVEWVKVALLRGMVEALDHARYELGRSLPSPALERLEELLRVAIHVRRTVGQATLEEAERLQPFDDPALEAHRLRCLQWAARGCPPDVERGVLVQARRWSQGVGEPWAHAQLESWHGSYLYRVGRFSASARRHLRAARLTPSPLDRITSRCFAASSLVEAFRSSEAVPLAELARLEAAALRHHTLEGRAEWIARTARYRLGEPLAPDLELAEAAQQCGSPDLAALVGITEGAFAWRNGQLEVGARLARIAVDHWLPMNRLSESALAGALAWACGDRRETADAIARRAMAGPTVTLRLQALALLTLGGERVAAVAGDLEVATVRYRGVAEECRMDVLSLAECRAALLCQGKRGRTES